jgi:hypothetical protein
MTTTANDITDAAYRKIGLSSPTDPEDTNALIALNNMISGWGTEFIVPVVTRESLDLVSGTAEYTIGSGGDLDTVVPMSIENAYLTDSDNYSYGLRPMAAKDYNAISSKTMEGRPTRFYFVPSATLAKVIFNKEANAVYTVYFEFWKNFTEFAAITTDLTLPNQYKEPLVDNLAIRLAEDKSIALPQTVLIRAEKGLVLISRWISVNRIPPLAKFDFTGGTYNITNDEYE